jgi:dolichol-phosphate mannosyltransferase
MHRFLPILFAIDGCSVVEVKVNHRERIRGKTKYGIRNRILRSWRAMKFVRYMQTHNLKYKIKEKF